LEDGNLYLRLRKVSHTIYAANGKVSHIHRHMCERDYTIDKSHTENSGFASPTLGQHISTFRGYRILFSIRNPYINRFTNHFSIHVKFGQVTGKLYNTSITSIVGVLGKLRTGTYTGLNKLVCMHDVSGAFS
jgi:hypothetical protein